ncbi:hypothetical protein [Nostoc parmelioides]|nr:hypothetical protein [Nostoc parmelioides]
MNIKAATLTTLDTILYSISSWAAIPPVSCANALHILKGDRLR